MDGARVGPADAEHAALLLPGGLCTAAFYDDVLADPRLKEAPSRFVATTVPGFGGSTPLASGVRAWVAFGDGKGEVGLTHEERRGLETCTSVELVTIRSSGHMTPNNNPATVVDLILDAATSVPRPA